MSEVANIGNTGHKKTFWYLKEVRAEFSVLFIAD
jgi:hypothetical protein